MLEYVKSRGIPTTLCTMYCPNFANPQQVDLSEPGLAALNNVIITQAIKVNTNMFIKSFSFDIFRLVGYSYH